MTKLILMLLCMASITSIGVAKPKTAQTKSKEANVHAQPAILEFGDLQCPDTAQFSQSLRPWIIQNYVNNGKVKYEFHDFPLDAHRNAIPAAAAARCGGSKVNQMREMILQNQGSMNPQTYAADAQRLGVNMQEFQSCERSNATVAAVRKDRALGESYGVHATPTLVLGLKTTAGFRAVKLIRGDKTSPAELQQEIAALEAMAR